MRAKMVWKRKAILWMLTVVFMTFSNAIPTYAGTFSDITDGTYTLQGSLSCYVPAMGGTEFGRSLLKNVTIMVSQGEAVMTISLQKSNVTIYGVTCDTFISAYTGTLGYYTKGGNLKTDIHKTISSDTAKDAAGNDVNYTTSISFPLDQETTTYQLALYVDSNVMGTQFGGDGKYNAVLTVDWSSVPRKSVSEESSSNTGTSGSNENSDSNSNHAETNGNSSSDTNNAETNGNSSSNTSNANSSGNSSWNTNNSNTNGNSSSNTNNANPNGNSSSNTNNANPNENDSSNISNANPNENNSSNTSNTDENNTSTPNNSDNSDSSNPDMESEGDIFSEETQETESDTEIVVEETQETETTEEVIEKEGLNIHYIGTEWEEDTEESVTDKQNTGSYGGAIAVAIAAAIGIAGYIVFKKKKG